MKHFEPFIKHFPTMDTLLPWQPQEEKLLTNQPITEGYAKSN